MILLADASANTLAILYVVIFIIAAFLAVCWIAFPFIVLSKFNELLKVARSMEEQVERMAAALKNLKTAHDETNNALQWLLDHAAGKDK